MAARMTGPEWQLCPVCAGRGWVWKGFYTGLGVATDTTNDQCRTCVGRGIIERPAPREAEIRRRLVGELRGYAKEIDLALTARLTRPERRLVNRVADWLVPMVEEALEADAPLFATPKLDRQ